MNWLKRQWNDLISFVAYIFVMGSSIDWCDEDDDGDEDPENNSYWTKK